MKKRLWSMRGLAALGGILLIAGTLALWVKRVVLETPTWTDTSTKILQDPTVQQTLSTYMVDQLYANVDVAAELRTALPQPVKSLAAPAAAGLREFLDRAALRTLQSDQVQTVWRLANRRANSQLIQLIDGGGSRLKTTNGDVVLDLHPLLERVITRAGLQDRVGGQLRPDAGRLTLLHSNNLKAAQDGAKVLRAAAYVLDILALLAFAAAIWIAPDHRRGLRACALAILSATLVLIFVRRVLGDQIIERLVHDEGFRPAAHAVWWIATGQLALANATLAFVGLVGLLGAWVAGPGEWARAVRRELTPYLRERMLAYGALAAVSLILLVWSPTQATRTWYTATLLLAMAIVGLELLRRQAMSDFPDAERTPLSLPRPRPREEAPVAATAGAEDLLLARLTRLGDLHERGVLSDEEFAREKQGLLAGPTASASVPAKPTRPRYPTRGEAMSFWDAFFLLLIYIPLIMIWAFAVFDIFRRDDIHGGSKALWLVCVILVPFFGTLIYLLFRRPGATPEERVAIDGANRDFVTGYSPSSPSEQLSVLADLHDRGKLSDSEFATEKARVLGSPPAAAASS